jgi:hypothetical protein
VDSRNAIARRAGLVYFVFMIVAIYREFLFPTVMVPTDAAATVGNIAAGQLTYRVGILLSFLTLVIFIFLVVLLYRLLKDVDESHALLMVLLVTIGVAIALANLHIRFAPLVLLNSADNLSAFTKPQLDAMALGVLGFHRSGASMSMVFWGLWLFPFGMLVARSGFLPRVLGILLLVAGFAYLVGSVTSIVLPAQSDLVSRVMMPLYFGEVPIIFWLLIKGAKAAQVESE